MATPDRSPSLFIGQQWSAWADLISSSEENGEEDGEEEKSKSSTSSDSMKLGKCDMGLFGICPARDEFSLVVCEKCKLLVKPQALKQHIESRHGTTNLSSLGNVPASALNSELGKKLLMPEPLKSPPVTSSSASSTTSSHRPSNSTFKQAQFGRPPTKASLKQVSASVRNNSAPKQGFSMKINSVGSVKGGNRVAPFSISNTNSGQSVSNPVVKVKKLQERSLSSSNDSNEKGQEPNIASVASSKSGAPTSTSSSFTKLESSKITTLSSGSLKSAVSLTTPSSLTFSSLPNVSTAVSLAITKTSTDTPINTRSLTTLVSTSTVTKPIMIAPVMTVASPMPTVSSKSSTSKSKLPKDQRERKFLPCKDREYDANKHCGVVVAETGKPCTRSLTCKTHALSLRRAVVGRCKPFDDLLKEHKAAKDAMLKAKAESQNEAAQSSNRILVSPSFVPASLASQKPQTASSVAIASMGLKDRKLPANAIVKPGLPASTLSSGSTTVAAAVSKSSRGHTNVFQRFSPNAVLPPAITVKEESVSKHDTPRMSLSVEESSSSIDSKDPCFLPHHPRPLATCTFGGRLNDRSCYLFSRKTDYVRAAFLSALERQLSPPPHKKLCVESNLPKDTQPPNNSQDPYEFNQVDNSGGAAALSLASSASKPNIKPKSKLPSSPIAASSAPSPMGFSSASLSSPSSAPISSTQLSSATLSPSLAAISPLSFSQPARVPSRSSKNSRDSLTGRGPDSSASSTLNSGQPNPGKRKRSGSSPGGGGGGGVPSSGNNNGALSASANGPLPSSPVASMAGNSGITLNTPIDLNASQLGLAGIITPTTLNNHQPRNLITIPGVNLASTVGASTKIGGSSQAVSATAAAQHKNNNIFKDVNFVLTGLDSSLNGQVVNITSAQLAELTGNQAQTLVLNNFPISATNNNTMTPSQTTSSISSVSTVAPPRPSKRHRSGSRSHQAGSVNSSKMASNPLEGFKIIPTNNVITSGSLPTNAVLMDSSSLQGAVLTLAGGGGTPTLVAITSTAGSSSNVTVPANPSGQVLCADTQISHTLLSNGLTQAGHDKALSGNMSSQRNLTSSSKPFLQQHNKNTQPGLALGNIIQGSSTLNVPLSSVSASQQICSNQALFKSGGQFNLTKSVGGKVTVQPVSLTFPTIVSQQGLAALTSAKSQHSLQQQQQQQQQAAHTLLVATSASAVEDPSNTAVRKSELHLHPQISNSSTSNVIS